MTLKRQMLWVMAAISALILLIMLESVELLQRIGAGIEERERIDEPYEAALEFRYHIAQVQQFATDASATGDAEPLREAAAHAQEAEKRLAAIAKSLPEKSGQVATIRANLEQFHQTGIRMANIYIQQGREAGNLVMKEPGTGFDVQARALTGSFDGLFKELGGLSETLKKESLETGRTGLITTLVAHLVLLILVVFTLAFGARRILAQLGGDPAHAVQVARDIAAGNLAIRIDGNPPEASVLAAMARMREGLSDMVVSIRKGADAVLEASGRLNREAAQVVNSSRQQSDAAASMSAATEEMTAAITQMADFSHNVSGRAEEAGAVAQSGGDEVHLVTEEIGRVAESVRQASQVIAALGEESRRITAIVDTIRDIADQTNLLALNAAIEAARAGEQGRGFAVVADEVRKLAERTTQSTQEISGMVEAISSRSVDAVRRMEQSLAQVAQGVTQADLASQAMKRVGNNSAQVVSEIGEMNRSLQEQRAASGQIARHVEQIAAMAERNSASVSEIATHVDHLERLAADLEARMQHFRT